MDFPALDPASLRAFRKYLDGSWREISRALGPCLEDFFSPLLHLLIYLEKLLLATPWFVVIGVIAALAYCASKSIKLTLAVALALFAIGFLGMWQQTMQTLSIILVCTLLAIILGLPLGILAAKSDRFERIIKPILDIMQTMPAFVYLIPVVMVLGIGRVSGVIAVVIYSISPVIRLTNLGIRMVDHCVLEAACAFGASARRRLTSVELPLALPTIMLGINQTIMMSLSMVVVASMIGVKGLGQEVLKAIQNQYFTLGLLNGLAIVALAIIFDRISQAFAQKSQGYLSHREQS